MERYGIHLRNAIAFWVFGLANNFAYVVMLSAAEDIIQRQSEHRYGDANNSTTSQCLDDLGKPRCEKLLSTGAVLLADIVPAFCIKFTFPFFMNRIPFGFRHFLVCFLQALSYVIVAFSTSIQMSLVGVVFASASSGLGEICCLALSSHYTKSSIAAWSSGTGGAGIFGALSYAALTEPKFFGLSPKNALLSMLIVPVLFALAFWVLLTPVSSVHKMCLWDPVTWVVPAEKKQQIFCVTPDLPAEMGAAEKGFPKEKWHQSAAEQKQKRVLAFTNEFSFGFKLRLILPLLRYMIPICLVYFAEYLINSGLHQLLHFDCAHGFSLSNASQFRWYQTLYQFGVFVSRSSVSLLELPAPVLFLLPFFQFVNIVLFYFQALVHFIPHIVIVFSLIFVEGLFGGASYVNTFNQIHKEALPEVREFSITIVSAADTIGISIAGFLSIIVHNQICQLYPRLYP